MALRDDLSVVIEGLGEGTEQEGLYWEEKHGRATVGVAAAGKPKLTEIRKRVMALGYDVRYRGETKIVVGGERM